LTNTLAGGSTSKRTEENMSIVYKSVCISRRGVLGLATAVLGSTMGVPIAIARERVRIGLATKTWWPSAVTEAAVGQRLFEKEGLEAELTVYRGGGEAFEALAAGAADLVINLPSLVATGRQRGVKAKIVATGGTANSGWHLIVPRQSPAKDVRELAGKKVGITSAGSLSDFLALWTIQEKQVQFTRVPLGGGGLVPNLLSGNVDAVVLYSPLSFQVMKNDGRSLIDYAEGVPSHLNSGWVARDDYIARKRDTLQKSLNAIYGGLAYLRENRSEAIKLLMKINEIPDDIAAMEYEQAILKLSPDGAVTLPLAEKALELARIGGMKDLAPAADIFTTEIRPVPTRR
jgi:ABC-type nitrate/sulfonate/bicarbonate transport system substrate-binding protein